MQNTARLNSLTRAMFNNSMPCNPIPFAQGLADLVRENGTDTIQTDDAKSMLWVLMAQAYGELATVDLHEEWSRLYKALPVGTEV